MRQLQVIPKGRYPLFAALLRKESELRRKKRGTFRSQSKKKGRAKWIHISYPGWIYLTQEMGEVVGVEVHPKKDVAEWQLLKAILGFLDRHFADEIRAINIQYGN